MKSDRGCRPQIGLADLAGKSGGFPIRAHT
jgi:hypothetical protein